MWDQPRVTMGLWRSYWERSVAVVEYSLIIDFSWENHKVSSNFAGYEHQGPYLVFLSLNEYFTHAAALCYYYVLYKRTTPLSVSQERVGQNDVFCSIIDDKVEKHVNWRPSLCCMVSPRPPLISYGTLHSSCWSPPPQNSRVALYNLSYLDICVPLIEFMYFLQNI